MSRSVSKFILICFLFILDAGAAARSGDATSAAKKAIGGFRASVVIISGDGGWGALEKDLAAEFIVQRMSVARINSRVAFSSSHSIADITRDIETSIQDRIPVILVGYSFGADLLPLIWPELSPEIRDRVVTISLIAPSFEGSTLVDPTDRYDPREHPMTPLAEHHARLPADRLMCVFGREERLSGYSSCPGQHLSKSHLIELDGGHDLGDRALTIASDITKFALDRVHRTAHLD
jgi:type IV secretory pathway VirJ component